MFTTFLPNICRKLRLNLLLLVFFSSIHLMGACADRPNIIFIFVDDQGYYDLGCYGATEVETPRIDALAENGVRFTDYYAAAPICSPSRAGLLTGCYPVRTGNHIWVHRPDAELGIPSSRLTMAELFKDAGYATACIGKWHLGFKDEFLPWNQGFDYYFGILHNMDIYEVVHFDDEGGLPLLRNGEVVERKSDPADLARRYTDEAISWIEKCVAEGKSSDHGKPFFIYLPHTMLHVPLGVSPEFQGSSNWGEYGDAIQEMDFHVGRIIDKLKQLEIDDNTLVMYVSDNGRRPGRNDEQPLRGSKLTTWEGGIRVPAIAAGGPIRKGFEPDAVTHAMDWYPTLASLAGITIPEDVILDGRDLSAMLLGQTDDIPAFDKSVSLNAEVPLRRPFNVDFEWGSNFTQREYLNAFFYYGSHGELSAVRWDKWKLVMERDLKLFNLEEDPGEKVDLRAPWPSEDAETSKDPQTIALLENWKIKSKLRGMIIQFQRELTESR